MTDQKNDIKQPGIWREIRNNFFYGIIVTLPIVAPVWLIIFVIRKTDELVKPLLPAQWNPDTYLPFSIPGLGLIMSIVALFILGTLAKNFFGRTLIGFGERILARVPIVSNLYTAGKQIVETVAEQSTKEAQEVCMLEYPRKGLWAVGFISSDIGGELRNHLPVGYVNIFVPTTPNPTSGFYLISKRSDLKILDLTPEEGAKLIVSAGMVIPQDELDEELVKVNNLKT